MNSSTLRLVRHRGQDLQTKLPTSMYRSNVQQQMDNRFATGKNVHKRKLAYRMKKEVPGVSENSQKRLLVYRVMTATAARFETLCPRSRIYNADVKGVMYLVNRSQRFGETGYLHLLRLRN